MLSAGFIMSTNRESSMRTGKLCLYISFILVSFISISQSYAQPHSHGGRSHTHGLPVQGIGHRHGNGAAGKSTSKIRINKPKVAVRNNVQRKTNKSNTHQHLWSKHNPFTVHTHPLPAQGFRHRHGNGTIGGSAKKDKYVGNRLNGKPHGKGTYEYKTGRKYVGNWSNGKMHGHGNLRYQNGGRFVGTFSNGNSYTGMHYTASGKKIRQWEKGEIVNTFATFDRKTNTYVDNSVRHREPVRAAQQRAEISREAERREAARRDADWEAGERADRERRKRDRDRRRAEAGAAQWKSTMDTLTAMSNPSFYTGSTTPSYKTPSRSYTPTTPSYSASNRSSGDSTFCKNGGSYRDRSSCISESTQNRSSWDISTVFKNQCSDTIKIAFCYSSSTKGNTKYLCSNSGNKPTQQKFARGGGEAVHFAKRSVNSTIGRKWIYDCKG